MESETVTAWAVGDAVETDAGTASYALLPEPIRSATRTATMLLTEDIGHGRATVRILKEDFDGLHEKSHSLEWETVTNELAKKAPETLMEALADLGFAWRDIARLVGVSVPAIQKWRRGEGVSGDNRRRLAGILAACDLIIAHYQVEDIASWFETPLHFDVPLTPLDLYAAGRQQLVFDYASGHATSVAVLNEFEPGWQEHYRSDFEAFRGADGRMSLRSKG
jgi:hypothetical protein